MTPGRPLGERMQGAEHGRTGAEGVWPPWAVESTGGAAGSRVPLCLFPGPSRIRPHGIKRGVRMRPGLIHHGSSPILHMRRLRPGELAAERELAVYLGSAPSCRKAPMRRRVLGGDPSWPLTGTWDVEPCWLLVCRMGTMAPAPYATELSGC